LHHDRLYESCQNQRRNQNVTRKVFNDAVDLIFLVFTRHQRTPMKFVKRSLFGLALVTALAGCGGSSTSISGSPSTPPSNTYKRTIIMVWDGLRPDSINQVDTPNLYSLRANGVEFADNHSVYPTFTMMNGQSFASGSTPGPAVANSFAGTGSGFYGNTFWQPNTSLTSGVQNGGATVSVGSVVTVPNLYIEPVFTEDHLILDNLNTYYQNSGDVGLLLVKSLFATAQSSGLTTATVGKAGAAYIQDFTQSNSVNRYFLDENSVRPASLINEMISAGMAIPADTQYDPQYAGTNDPTGTAGGLASYMAKQTPLSPTYRAGANQFASLSFDSNGLLALNANDPSDTFQGAPEDSSNKYMMQVYTNLILPKHAPDLSLIWFRTPDNVEHAFGPGSPNAIAGLRSQDARLGELIAALRNNGMDTTTNIIVVSDHGHSSVAGPAQTFPLRKMVANSASNPIATTGVVNGKIANTGSAIGAVTTNTYSYRCTATSQDPTKTSTFGVQSAQAGCTAANVTTTTDSGYSFSGDIRIADILYYRGINVYDGANCATTPMVGLTNAGTPVVPLKKDLAGTVCAAGALYMANSATPPNGITPRANFVLPSKSAAFDAISTNQGGSDFIYVPSHDANIVSNIVKFLQQRPEFGAIFVDSRYLPGGSNAPATAIAGVLPMKAVNLENSVRQNKGQPDIVVSFNWSGVMVNTTSTIASGTTSVNYYGLPVTASAPHMVQGMPGTTYESYTSNHGMHGSMGTTDVHNTLIANGPAFQRGIRVTNPSGNIDVAPTVAYILGTSMASTAQGRVLNEGLNYPATSVSPTVVASVLTPSNWGVAVTATGLKHESFTDQTGATPALAVNGDPVDLTAGTYTINLGVKDLTVNGQTYRYFDYAQAVRK
jgi:Type I phosphodiesterase / nucleotide pyrophosphatase